MASIITHMAVSDKLYKRIKDRLPINYYDYMLGSIAPDISKTIGASKNISHFLDNSRGIPNVDNFLRKYANTLTNSFNLGYFIHLYTDKLFYRDYYPLFIQDDIFYSIVKCLDGSTIKLNLNDRREMLYNDYTNLNAQIIDEYQLILDIFYNEFILPQTNITEIPVDKLNILIDNTSTILQNLNTEKDYIIDISSIKSFIDDTVEEIYTKLISLDLI